MVLCVPIVIVGATSAPPGVAVLSHADLVAGGDTLNSALNLAFIGDASYGLVIVRDIPGFAAARHAAMNDTVRLARAEHSPAWRVRNTWPGVRHTLDVHEPLQGGFLHNALEDVGPSRVDPVFGKNLWPNDEHKAKMVAVNALIWNVSLAVLRGADRTVEREAARACQVVSGH